MIAAETIAAIKQATDMQALAAEYVRLKKSGPTHVAICPFHDEKTPSLRVYVDHFHCFGCNTSGSPIDWVMKLEDVGFQAATRILAERVGISIDHKPVTRLQVAYGAEEREYCAWWFKYKLAMLQNLIHAEIRDCSELEDVSGYCHSLTRLRTELLAVPALEHRPVFLAVRSDTDRLAWEASKADAKWWLETIKHLIVDGNRGN